MLWVTVVVLTAVATALFVMLYQKVFTTDDTLINV